MIRVQGREYKTISDAARTLGVSDKTVRSYISRGIIDEPPHVDFGLRRVMYFTPRYLKKAQDQIERHKGFGRSDG